MSNQRMPAVPVRRKVLSDLLDVDSPHVYVMNRAINLTGKPTTLLLPHTSSSSGDTKPLELPMTTNPIDLSEYAPKDELMRNSELLRMISRRVLELVSDEQAESILSTPEGILEQDRIEAQRMQGIASTAPDGSQEDESFKAQLPPIALQPGAQGDVNLDTNGITPSIVDAISNGDYEDGHRIAIMRNLASVLTDADKKWVRGKTTNPDIRKLVG